MSDPSAIAAMQQQVAAACMETKELIAPILDSAEGVKADMVGRGWAEANAERVATSYVQSMLKRVIEGAS
ncbi:hypothetical protein [Streptomyces scabiei]|uniref:hypothetical protein n=1 Tax=Streptomyces scabiei TaxID=1930 RepID=UPI0029B4AD02|nr:hypothetical protein [Streptomyces scabiei]MDX2800198.1 hypothetical protein [Streptomyces scabiei]MDX3124545.1 hypothetical protein [Streptomyces scabiei]